MEALYGVRSYLENIRQDHVVMTDSDLIINIPLQQVYEDHMASGADITCVCTAHPGRLRGGQPPTSTGQEGWITETVFGVRTPRAVPLPGYLHPLQAAAAGAGGGVRQPRPLQLPQRRAPGHGRQPEDPRYVWDGYSAQIRSLEEYYDRSMELLDPAIRRELFPKDRPIYTKELQRRLHLCGPGRRLRQLPGGRRVHRGGHGGELHPLPGGVRGQGAPR